MEQRSLHREAADLPKAALVRFRGAPAPLTPEVIQLLATGPVLTSALYAALDLGVFDQLTEGALSAGELAQRLTLENAAAARFLTMLAALGLLERGSDGRFRNHPITSAALTQRGESSIVPLLEYQREDVFERFSGLASALRGWTGDVPAVDPYRRLSNDAARYERMLRAMNVASAGVAAGLVEQAELHGIRRLVDLGGGGGQMAIELCQALPHLSIELVETEVACDFARRHVEAHGLSERIQCVALDVREDLSSLRAADAVLLSGVISDFSREERSCILRNARKLLMPSGKLLVSETLLNDTRTGPLMPAFLSLYMLLSTGGDNFTQAEIEEMLDSAGFDNAQVFLNGARGQRDLVVAKNSVASSTLNAPLERDTLRSPTA